MIYFLDFDFTIADTTALLKGAIWRVAQQFMPEITIFPNAVEFINGAIQRGDEVFIVSCNVGSTIKLAVDHFNIPIKKENVFGYRWGYPMENLKRKVRVIQEALKHVEDKNEVVYIGDDEDDAIACQEIGIRFIYEWFSGVNHETE